MGVARPAPVVQNPAQTAALQAARRSIADLEATLQAMAQRAGQAERAQEEAEIQVGELRRAVESWRVQSEKQTRQLTEAQGALRTRREGCEGTSLVV